MMTIVVCMRDEGLQTSQFPEQHLVDDLYPAPAFFDVLAYIINIIKEIAEGIQ